MNSGFVISLLALSAVLAGCSSPDGRLIIGHSDSVRFKLPSEASAVRHEPVTPFEIDVVDISTIKRPYVVVGLAEAETSTMHEAVDRLRQEAAKIGGDAIADILPAPGGIPSMGVPILGDLSFRSGRIWTARVIRWFPADAPAKDASGLH